MEDAKLRSLIREQMNLLAELEKELSSQAPTDVALGWCSEHAFVVVTRIRPHTTGLSQFSCGCPPYTKAREVTYEEAIEIAKGIKHALPGGIARFERDGIHVNVVRYEGTEEDFEGYCEVVNKTLQMERIKR